MPRPRLFYYTSMPCLSKNQRRNLAFVYLGAFVYLPALWFLLQDIPKPHVRDIFYTLFSLYLLCILLARLSKDMIARFPQTTGQVIFFFLLQCGGLLFVLLTNSLTSAMNAWLLNAAILVCAASLSLAIEGVLHHIRGTSGLHTDFSITLIVYYGVLPSTLLFGALLLFLLQDIPLMETLITIGSFVFALLFHLSIFLRMRLREMFG